MKTPKQYWSHYLAKTGRCLYCSKYVDEDDYCPARSVDALSKEIERINKMKRYKKLCFENNLTLKDLHILYQGFLKEWPRE